MIIYWSWPIPAKFQGCNYGPISFIRPECKEDLGLQLHENTHQKQFRDNPILFPWRYAFCKERKLKYEVEAYREQLKLSPGKAGRFAEYLCNNYGFTLSAAEAIRLLTEEIPNATAT